MDKCLTNPKLTASERLVHYYFIHHPSIQISAKQIAEYIALSDVTVHLAADKLQDLGYISIQKSHSRKIPHSYTLLK